MKLCRYCGKQASIFLTQITGGKLTDLALCKQCARERGIFDPRKLNLASSLFPEELSGEVESFIRKMLESAGIEETENEVASTLPDMLTECPTCHFPLNAYYETFSLGCPDCYKAFSSELLTMVDDPDVQAEARAHVEADILDSPVLERGRLEVLMRDAIKNEDYEEAARLRDRIKNLAEK